MKRAIQVEGALAMLYLIFLFVGLGRSRAQRFHTSSFSLHTPLWQTTTHLPNHQFGNQNLRGQRLRISVLSPAQPIATTVVYLSNRQAAFHEKDRHLCSHNAGELPVGHRSVPKPYHGFVFADRSAHQCLLHTALL